MSPINSLLHRTLREHSIVEKVFKTSLTTYMLYMLTWSIGTLVDGAFIGNFLGVDAVASYGMIWPLTLVFGLIGSILSGGSRNLYTNLAGHGKVDEANRAFTLACLMSVAFSLAFVAVVLGFHTPISALLGARGKNAHLQSLIGQYLIALVLGLPFDSTAKIFSSYMGMDSDHLRMVYATVALTVADIVGDIVAIYVYHGGMFALGLATAIGQLVYFAVLSTHFLRKKRMLRFAFKGLRPEFDKIWQILSRGAPAGTTRIASAIGGIMVNRIIAGAAASNVIAAYSVHKSIGALVSATYFGIADTVWTLSSIYFGEEDRKALDELQKTALRIGAKITGITAVFLLIFSRFFAGLYMGHESEDALTLGAQSIRLLALSVPLYLLVYFFDNYLMGVNRLRSANIYSLLLECGALVPTV